MTLFKVSKTGLTLTDVIYNNDLFLPDYKSENKISKVAVAFDVSGSVTKAQIKAFLNEMKVIKNQLDPETMDVVSFNHEICRYIQD